MRQSKSTSGERIVKDIKRKTRKQYSAEENIRIVLDGLRGEESIAELCRQEGIAQGLYYKWSKDFLEAGKKRLAGDITRQANSTEVKELRADARELKECVAELTLENRLLKKKQARKWGRRFMRYPASEKLEIIRMVERSSRPAKWTLDKLGVQRRTFYRWYDRYLEHGEDGLVDRAPHPGRVWNKIPDNIRSDILDMALEIPELLPRELAVRFTDTKGYFVSESSVYRLLKAHDLISSPAFIVMKAASEFRDKTTAINQMWQTDFTYFKIIHSRHLLRNCLPSAGWGWMYLSTILDDFSRYIISWKLCSTMKTSDVTETLNMALEASGCDQANVVHKPRLLSDNGASYISHELADYIKDNNMSHVRGAPYHPQTQGKIERWHQTLKNRTLLENYFLPGDLEPDRRLRRALQS